MRRLIALSVLSTTLLLAAQPLWAQSLGAPKPPRQQRWALGFMVRNSNIPFGLDDKTVSTLIPLIMFENKRFFFREIEGGVKIFRFANQVEFSALGRMHYFDIPQQLQNKVQGDTVDWGIQTRFWPDGVHHLDFEILSDTDRRISSIARLMRQKQRRHFNFTTWLFAQYTTAKYNSHFWGLDLEPIGSGVSFGGGLRARWNVISSLYVMGAGKLTYLAEPIRKSTLVNEDWKWETFVGFGFSDPKDKPRTVRLPENAYLRFAHGKATPTSLAGIIRGNAEADPGNNVLSTLFYGHPLTDRIFGLPIYAYFHTGLGVHWKSEVQKRELEGIVSIKLYYTIPLPWRIRIGMAEGVSYVTNVPAREKQNLTAKGYDPSPLLNYLDPSVDINLGDIIPGDALKGLWLGYYIHHRSAIFETAQQFGRIKGGSNFQMLYLQYQW